MYFSVKKTIKIAGKTYIPCICYEVTKALELTVAKLERAGKVATYSEKVFFQNGKVIKKESVVKESVVKESVLKESLTAESTDTEEVVMYDEAEDTDEEETSSDESEGF